MINKGEVYILNQPRKGLLSIVVVDSFPNDDKISKSLDDLAQRSDVIFVFCDDHFPVVGCSEMYKRKFVNLYSGCGFIDTSGNNIGYSIFRAMHYDRSIFKTHHGISISTLSTELKTELLDNLEKVNNSDVSAPIFKIDRILPTELFEYYVPRKEVVGKICKKSVKKYNESELYHCRYKSSSKLLYIGKPVIDVMLESFIQKDQDTLEYIESFSRKSDPMYLFASYIKYLEIVNIDNNLEDLQINKL